VSPAVVINYEYDAQGNPTKTLQAPGSMNLATSTRYDALNSAITITDAKLGLTQLAYDGLDRNTQVIDPRGLVTQTPRNGLGDVTQLVSPDTGTANHTWDAVGNLLTRINSRGVLASHSYDALNRLTQTIYSQAGKPSETYTWGYDQVGAGFSFGTSWSIGYDANGNRTGVTLSGNTSSYTTATTSNKLTNISNPANSLSYDVAGNTLATSDFAANYDLSNRMVALTKAGITTTYSHNGMGQRVRKFSSSGPTSTMLFVYGQDGNLLGEYDATGKPIKEYVWLGMTPIAVFTPDPVNAANPPLTSYIHADHIDTPRAVVDQNDKLRWRWMAEPFGTSVAETNPANLGAFSFNLRFPGQYFDQESGLNYNWWRSYDAVTGRYITSDPVGLDGGLNTFLYVVGDPINYIDPNGLICVYSQSARTIVCTNDGVDEPYLSCEGYSGTGPGRDNPDAQNQRSVGPLPRGDYTVGESFRHGHAGPGTRRLTPVPGNNMEDRDGFLIHGNNAANDASNGCVILPPRCRSAIPTGETLRVIR
jgi:RHS repeat-associated protein